MRERFTIFFENLPVVASSIVFVTWLWSSRVTSAETDEASNTSVIVTSRRTEFIIFVEKELERNRILWVWNCSSLSIVYSSFCIEGFYGSVIVWNLLLVSLWCSCGFWSCCSRFNECRLKSRYNFFMHLLPKGLCKTGVFSYSIRYCSCRDLPPSNLLNRSYYHRIAILFHDHRIIVIFNSKKYHYEYLWNENASGFCTDWSRIANILIQPW